MKSGLFILILTMGIHAQATYIPQGETLTVGGRVLNPNKPGFKMLIGYLAATSNWSTLREPNATAGYQVPGSKTFKILAVEMLTESTAGPVIVAYGDNDVGFAVGTVPTNAVFPGGDGAMNVLRTASAAETKNTAYFFSVPTGKYPAISANGGAGGTRAEVKVYGYEE